MRNFGIILTIGYSLGLIFPQAAVAFEKGDWLLRARAVAVHPDEEAEVTPIGGDVNINTAFIPELDLSYFLTDRIALEGIFGIIPHKAKTKNTAIGDQDVGYIWAIAPTLLLQYHHEILDGVKPYLGAGMAYVKYFEQSGRHDIQYRDDVAMVVQAGLDVAITERWSANFDLKQAWADTRAKVDGGAVTADVRFDPVVVSVGVGYKF